MDYEDFKRIFEDEGVRDERVIFDKWKLANLFEDAANLDEKILRWSIRTYMPEHIEKPATPPKPQP